MKHFQPRDEPTPGVDPLVWGLHSLLIKREIPCAYCARKSGISLPTLYKWFKGRNVPTISNFQAALNAIGYELVIAPRN